MPPLKNGGGGRWRLPSPSVAPLPAVARPCRSAPAPAKVAPQSGAEMRKERKLCFFSFVAHEVSALDYDCGDEHLVGFYQNAFAQTMRTT